MLFPADARGATGLRRLEGIGYCAARNRTVGAISSGGMEEAVASRPHALSYMLPDDSPSLVVDAAVWLCNMDP